MTKVSVAVIRDADKRGTTLIMYIVTVHHQRNRRWKIFINFGHNGPVHVKEADRDVHWCFIVANYTKPAAAGIIGCLRTER